MVKGLKSELQGALGEANVLSDPDSLRNYGRDWNRALEPAPSLVVRPGTYAEVQTVVKIAARAGAKLVPSGGRTGLSGGATATQGEIVISLERLNQVLEISKVDRTVKTQAGVITQKLKEAALQSGLYFPVSMASEGSSQIGGNIATNAGGIHVIRYGNTRDWVLGLKVVTADGELLELNGALFKNQTGYDLRSLFIGSEGTLGIIVEATLKLCNPPGELVRAVCGVEKLTPVLEILTRVRASFSELSAFEYFSGAALELVLKHQATRDPFSTRYPHYLLLEFEHANSALETRIGTCLADLNKDGLITDAVLSQSHKQAAELMALRELISPTLGEHYFPHKNDISVPVPRLPEFLGKLDARISANYPGTQVIVFGHVGDGNLHINVLKPANESREQFKARCHPNDAALFTLVKEFGGSISAEHGIGLLKKPYLHFSRSPAEIALMRRLKNQLDPAQLFNPGKVFDPQ